MQWPVAYGGRAPLGHGPLQWHMPASYCDCWCMDRVPVAVAQYTTFRKYGHWCYFACLFKCSLFRIFVYGSLICIYLMNILVKWLIQNHLSQP